MTTGHAAPADPAAGRLISGREALALLEPDLGRRPLLVVTDFDGTLSPIVQDPWGARILPQAQRALRRLAGRPDAQVVILSGRTAVDLAGRVRVGGALYLGNHGLERGDLPRRGRPERLQARGDPELDPYTPDAERLAEAMPRLIRESWLIVERKGPAVSFHFRAAPDVAAAAQRVMAAVETLDPDQRFDRLAGRRVLELRPPGAEGKGEAMAGLLEAVRPGLVVALGDDTSDAEAFAALRAARRRGPLHGLALAVQARSEVPASVAQAADGVLASPLEAARFLGVLADRLG